jgi:hypothetical protein
MTEERTAAIVALERTIARLDPQPTREGPVSLLFTELLLQENQQQVMARLNDGTLALAPESKPDDIYFVGAQVLDLAYQKAQTAAPIPDPTVSGTKRATPKGRAQIMEEAKRQVAKEALESLPPELRDAFRAAIGETDSEEAQ